MDDTTPSRTDRLLDDDAFIALMEAEYRAHGQAPSPEALAHGFAQIAAKLPEPALGRAVWAGPLAMAALLFIGLAPSLFKANQASPRGIKGLDPGLPVSLHAFVLGAGGTQTPVLDKALQPGAVLIFNVSLPAPGYVALAVSEGTGQALVRFESGPLLAGEDQIVERESQAYAYRVDGDEPQFTVCAVAGSSLAELTKVLSELAGFFPRLGARACVTATVAGSSP